MIAPAARTAAVTELLEGTVGVTNLVVLTGVAREPAGDLVMCDVVREAADGLLHDLRVMNLEEDGSIAIDAIDTWLSRRAEEAEREAPGESDDAVVWSQVEERTSDESTLSFTFLAFLTIAAMIAAIGVLLDQPILIVGAMVVGPEFGPLAALCLAITLRRGSLAVRSLRALVVGFPVAIGITVLATLVGRAAGLVKHEQLSRNHPLTEFISQPDTFSFIVAFLASVAGILSLTSAKSGALIGVLISVTTVPAAGSAAVAVALGEYHVAGGSLLQLLVNLVAIVLAGTLTLMLQRSLWQITPAPPRLRNPVHHR